MAQNPIVTIEMENGDIMKAELYPEIAPNTVNNFISLINKGFYDGLIFHRVINGFMIQGGCPDGNGMGGPGYGIKGEFAQNGVINQMKHTAGVLSMARAMHPNSAGSQFFLIGKLRGHDTGIISDRNSLVLSVLGNDVVCQSLGCLTNRINIHTVCSCADYPAQTTSTKLQLTVKTILDLCIISL